MKESPKKWLLRGFCMPPMRPISSNYPQLPLIAPDYFIRNKQNGWFIAAKIKSFQIDGIDKNVIIAMKVYYM